MAPSFLSEALREPLGSPLTSEGAVRERRHAEDCSSVCLERQAYVSSAGERKETLEGVRGGAPAREGNGGAMASIVELSFIEVLIISVILWPVTPVLTLFYVPLLRRAASNTSFRY